MYFFSFLFFSFLHLQETRVWGVCECECECGCGRGCGQRGSSHARWVTRRKNCNSGRYEGGGAREEDEDDKSSQAGGARWLGSSCLGSCKLVDKAHSQINLSRYNPSMYI
ncbi:hypothetical protein F5X96DRAFT_631223 [Biscogniauxia mediterranea]|nr:hypothetical protein F5X96DRAFT_631223 [Biscogniauxia mediterranea]